MTENSDDKERIKQAYPSRYYALYDKEASEPAQIKGWYDVWVLNDLSSVPKAEDMLPITAADMPQSGQPVTPKAVLNGMIVSYTEALPLPSQAEVEWKWIQGEASLVAAMGQVFTEDMKKYVKYVQAIIAGTDTTSTSLPMRPTDIAA
ncbi:MAG: hypothetical protein GX413_09865 [Acetobacter sp.]|nr:hypothetical protein [Acetobacter sp.]